MMHFLSAFSAEVRRDPVRSLLTMLGIAVGVTVVTLTLDVSNGLVAASGAGFRTPGLRMIVATGTRSADGALSDVAGVLTAADVEAIRRLVPQAKAVSPVESAGPSAGAGLDLGTIEVEGSRYRTRSVAAVGAGYAEVYGLAMAAGTFFGSEDSGSTDGAVVISEETARALFGSAEAALGRTLVARSQPGNLPRALPVRGVYRDLPDTVRDGYGIGDILVPLAVPSARLGALAVLVVGMDERRAAAALTAAVRSLHGSAVPVLAWKGSRSGSGAAPAARDDEVATVAVFIDAFGALALLVSATGILTTCMVSAVERSRAAGLRRALGARRGAVARWVVGEALLLAVPGVVLGTALAALLAGPAVAALQPIFPGAEDGFALSPGLRADAVLAAAGLAFAAVALFSLAPAAAAASAVPAESMRDA